MNNILNKTMLGALLLGSSLVNRATAQLIEKENLSFGAGVGLTTHASLGSSLSYNIRGNYFLDEKNAIVVGYNSQLPVTSTYTDNARAASSTTVPGSVTIEVEQKVSFHNVSIDYHRYLVGDMEESFGLYGLFGVGLTFAKLTETYGNYDRTLYNYSRLEPESLSGAMINLGLGANFLISDKIAL
ncbi:MAG: hypothetical protein EAY81_12530, partial [Bacteroidetes bacterium]